MSLWQFLSLSHVQYGKLVIFTKQNSPQITFFSHHHAYQYSHHVCPYDVYDCLINILLIFHRPAFWGSMIPLIIHSSEVEMCSFYWLMLVKQYETMSYSNPVN